MCYVCCLVRRVGLRPFVTRNSSKRSEKTSLLLSSHLSVCLLAFSLIDATPSISGPVRAVYTYLALDEAKPEETLRYLKDRRRKEHKK